MKVKINGEEYTVEATHRYNKNERQPVLEIFDEIGMPSGVISICIPGVHLEERETILNVSDCEELLTAMVTAGIAIDTTRRVRSGYAEYPIVKLAEEVLQA